MDEQTPLLPGDHDPLASHISSNSAENRPQVPASRTLLYILTVVFILILFVTTVLASRMLKYKKQSASPTPTPQITFGIPEPSMTPIPTVSLLVSPTLPVSTTSPNPAPAKKSSLFQLGFNTINYSGGWPTGDVAGATARLYDSQGKLLGEKVVPPVTYQGNVGSGGNVMFGVPLGTYKVVIETDSLTGTKEVTIRSFDDQQYYSVYMYAKPITISGYYFIDQNKNNQFDSGEKILPNKRINVTVKTGRGDLYESGITTTNNEGFYTVTGKYVGSYTLYGEYEPGNIEQPAHWVSATGGQSITLHYYLWPDN